MAGWLAAAGVVAVGLIVWGVADELQRRRGARVHHTRWLARAAGVIRSHPLPLYGVVETLLWLGVLASLADHLRDPANSTTAIVTWYLTIGVHELGHVVCMPFGWFLHVAGGSIWQVLFWAALGAWALIVQRRLTLALLMWTITGHSLINLARYIGDARARELKLLFGLGPESHDWWNLLSRYDLLDSDHVLANISAGLGAIIVVGAVMVGIVTTWMLPRIGLFGQARAVASWMGTGAQAESVVPDVESMSGASDD